MMLPFKTSRRVGSRTLRWWYFAAASAISACAVTTLANAAPIPGGTHTSNVLGPPAYVYFQTPGGTVDGGLVADGCPFVPSAPAAAALTSTLTVRLNGWDGPIQNPDTNPSQQLLVRGQVSGMVRDATGNVYHVAGDFLDSSTHYLFDNDLLFDGSGTLTLAGQGGVMVGEADLRVANAPLEFSFTVNGITQCTIRPAG